MKRGVKKNQFGLFETSKRIEADYSASYRERHPDRAADSQRRYRAKHAEEIRERRRAKYYANINESRKTNREKSRRWRLEVVGGFHRYHLTRNYGPGAADHYGEQIKQQNGMCAACGRLPKGKLHLDHNHATKQFRGLLCGNCNRSLGLMEENVEYLERLITYIKKWREAAAA